MAKDNKPTNQDQKPDGGGNPPEEGTDSGTGALDDATRSTKDRAEGAAEAAPRGQGMDAERASKKVKPGEPVLAANLAHGEKTYPAGTPLRHVEGLTKDQHADLKAGGHIAKAPDPDDDAE